MHELNEHSDPLQFFV